MIKPVQQSAGADGVQQHHVALHCLHHPWVLPGLGHLPPILDLQQHAVPVVSVHHHLEPGEALVLRVFGGACSGEASSDSLCGGGGEWEGGEE